MNFESKKIWVTKPGGYSAHVVEGVARYSILTGSNVISSHVDILGICIGMLS